MEWLRHLWAKLTEHKFWGLILFSLLAIAALGRVIRGLERIKTILGDFFSHAATVDPTGKLTVKDSYAWGAVVFLVVLLLLFLLGLRNQYELGRVRKELKDLQFKTAKRDRVVEKTFEKMMLAASQILGQLYPITKLPQKNLLRSRRTYLVSENFDTAVTREDDYKAHTDLHIEHIRVGAEPDAEPCEFLDDIDFKVRDENPLNQVVYIPTRNTPYEKSVILFFLPHISPEEPAPRRIIVTYRWPKMMRQLERKGFEIGEWTLKSQDPIPLAEMRLFFAPGLKNKINVSIHGSRIPGDSVKQVVCDVPGFGSWEGWCYNLENAPAGRYHVKIELRK